jgi:hypothetical protein
MKTHGTIAIAVKYERSSEVTQLMLIGKHAGGSEIEKYGKYGSQRICCCRGTGSKLILPIREIIE